MKKFKSFLFVICLLLSTMMFTAAIAPSSQTINPKPTVTAIEIQNAINNNQLGKLVEKATGEKLTLKDKIALKVFGRKIKNISKSSEANAPKGGKSQLVALLLAVFIGTLGIHRFYLGHIWQGVVQLLTLGGCYIWWIIDVIRIATGDLKPRGGDYETKI